MNNIPAFFQTLCHAKQIYNATPQDLLVFFPPNSEQDLFIKLDEYDCICVGYNKGVKQCLRFKILSCEDQPLIGRHKICINDRIISPDSLTYFKKDILEFQDHVSFERATFLLLEPQKKVFRLNLLRSRITLPLFKGGRSQRPRPLISPEEISPLNQIYFKVNVDNPSNIINHYKESFSSTFDTLKDEFEDIQECKNFFNAIIRDVFEKCLELIHDENIETVAARAADKFNDDLMLEDVGFDVNDL